jgi:predicted deacetylase
MFSDAQYLVRFDDLCPTMNWTVWRQVEAILLEYGVNPILAVVPDNQDKDLMVAKPHRGFWDEVRLWQSRGWTIGLHGYQHAYVTRDAGIVGINRFSEFSGLSYDEQSRKLERALEILQREGVTPEIWVAPAHSFDHTTVRALNNLGIRHISDGLFLFPGLDSLEMMWIPQQFWRFRAMPLGVWTVCCHLNRWTTSDVSRLRANLERFRNSIVDFHSAASAYRYRRQNLSDTMYAVLHAASLKLRNSVLARRTS